MIELQVGKRYSTAELCQAIGISTSTFRHKKEKYITSLNAAYTYQIETEGRAVYYVITKKIGDYEKPLRKNNREKTDQVVKSFIRETIDKDPVQTAANINRLAWSNTCFRPSEIVLLGLKNSTTKEYIRLNLKEMFGSKVNEGGTEGVIQKRIWCRLEPDRNVYVQLEPDQIKEFFGYVDSAKQGLNRPDIEAIADYVAGEASEEEAKNAMWAAGLSAYQSSLLTFYFKYGYFPMRASVFVPILGYGNNRRS